MLKDKNLIASVLNFKQLEQYKIGDEKCLNQKSYIVKMV